MNLQERIITRLETSGAEEVPAILDAKLSATGAERVVDYVALSIDNLDGRIEQIKQAEKELKQLKKECEDQKDIIKIGSSSWLSEVGVDSLKGLIVSSVKVVVPKATEEVIIENEEALINGGYFKMAVDKTAVKKALLDGVEVDGAKIEITHKEPTITIYKKR